MFSKPANKDTKAVFCHAPDAAVIAGLPIRTFHEYRAKGIFPSYKLGRHRLFKKEEIVAAIERFREASTSDILQ